MQAPDKKCKLSFFIKDTYTGDPGDPLSLNLYTYCHNEPIMYDDPDGHRYVKRHIGTGSFVTEWVNDPAYIYVNGQEVKGELTESGRVVASRNAMSMAVKGYDYSQPQEFKAYGKTISVKLDDAQVSVRDYLILNGMDNSHILFSEYNGVYNVYAKKPAPLSDQDIRNMLDTIQHPAPVTTQTPKNYAPPIAGALRSYLHGVSTAIVQDYTYGLAPEANFIDVQEHQQAYYIGKETGHFITMSASVIEGGTGGGMTIGGAPTVVVSAEGTLVMAHAASVMISSQANRARDKIMYASTQGMGGSNNAGIGSGTGSNSSNVPNRNKPRIENGDLKEGWAHIDARHITGNHPDGAGDLFSLGTTRSQIQQAANTIIKKGKRISDPVRRIQTFEKDIVVNGKKDLVRVIVDSGDGNRVITIFPVRGGH